MKNEKRIAFSWPYVGTSEEKGRGMLYNEAGDYSCILKIENPVMEYSADVEEYYKFHNIFTQILKLIIGDYSIQKQDILTKKKYKGKLEGEYLSDKYQKHFENREYTEISTYITITRHVKRSRLFQFDGRDWKQYHRNIEKIKEILESKKISCVILSEAEVTKYIKRCVSFSFSRETFHFRNFKSEREKLVFGDDVVKIISLVDVDEMNVPEKVKPFSENTDLGYVFPVDLMNFLNTVPEYETIIYNQVVRLPHQIREIRKLEAKKRRSESIPDPANDLTREDIENFLVDVAKNNQVLAECHFSIAVKCKEKNLSRAENNIENSLFNAGIVIGKNNYNQLELYRSNLPGNTGELKSYDRFMSTTDSAVCFFFKERTIKDEESGFKIFFCDRQGRPVAMDPADKPMQTNRINNRNKFVLGPSGSGKSFFMNHVVRQYCRYDMDVVLVDTGHSYSGICDYFNGKYITYSENNPITMNPFIVKKEEYNEEKREFIKSLIGLIWKGADETLNQVEDSVLSNVISEYYGIYFEGKNDIELSFNSFYEYSIHKIEEIKQKEGIEFNVREYRFILKKFYKGGEYEVILNENMDSSLFDEKFIVFEIDAIKEHKILFPITTLIIMDVFIQKMRHKKSRKALIIEEAWKAIASPMMAGYILYLYKTVRKFWGEAIVVTQELDDILGNVIVKDSILNNSDTIILLDQTKFKDNYQVVAKLLALNEVEQNKIFTINNLDNKDGRSRFKEVYIKRGATGEVYGVEVSLEEYLAYTTERSEKEAIKLYVDKFGDFENGVNNFIEDMKASGKKLSDFVEHVNKHKLQKLRIA